MARILSDSFASAPEARPTDNDCSDPLVEMQRKVDNLQVALATQRTIGTVIGLVAQRYGCTTDQAWSVLVRLSQETQVKVRDLARVLRDAFDGQLRDDDADLLATVAGRLPGEPWPDR